MWGRLVAQCRLVFLRDLCRTIDGQDLVVGLPQNMPEALSNPTSGCSRRRLRRVSNRRLRPRKRFCINRAQKPSGIGLVACGRLLIGLLAMMPKLREAD